MDTCTRESISTDSLGRRTGPRRQHTIEEKLRIVKETHVKGASVATVARRHDVNANQVFYWRKRYREGRLGSTAATKLLPVKVAEERSMEAKDDGLARRWGTMEIQLAKGTLRIAGAVDVVALRVAIESLVA